MCRETASQSQKVPDRINSSLNLWLWVQTHMPWIKSLQAKKSEGSLGLHSTFPCWIPSQHTHRGRKRTLWHESTDRCMIGNSWVTTLKRASQSQGLERVPALIDASFSTILHLNRCESIISHFPRHKQLPLHLLTMHLQFWLVLRRHEAVQGKSFKDAGEFFFIPAWLTHNRCVYTGLCQHCQLPAMKKKQKL